MFSRLSLTHYATLWFLIQDNIITLNKSKYNTAVCLITDLHTLKKTGSTDYSTLTDLGSRLIIGLGLYPLYGIIKIKTNTAGSPHVLTRVRNWERRKRPRYAGERRTHLNVNYRIVLPVITSVGLCFGGDRAAGVSARRRGMCAAP